MRAHATLLCVQGRRLHGWRGGRSRERGCEGEGQGCKPQLGVCYVPLSVYVLWPKCDARSPSLVPRSSACLALPRTASLSFTPLPISLALPERVWFICHYNKQQLQVKAALTSPACLPCLLLLLPIACRHRQHHRHRPRPLAT